MAREIVKRLGLRAARRAQQRGAAAQRGRRSGVEAARKLGAHGGQLNGAAGAGFRAVAVAVPVQRIGRQPTPAEQRGERASHQLGQRGRPGRGVILSSNFQSPTIVITRPSMHPL